MPPPRSAEPAPNPYVLDPQDHPQMAARPAPAPAPALAPVPEPQPRGMVLGPRDANGGYMVRLMGHFPANM